MFRFLFLIALCLAALCWWGSAACDKTDANPPNAPMSSTAGVTVYFSPETNLSNLIIQRINNAQRSVYVQAYSFSSSPIADALIAAQGRGLEVKVLLDAEKAVEEESESWHLLRGGVATFADNKERKAHSKIILIDGRTIITGSFNFADAKEEGTADNLIVLDGKSELLTAYDNNFNFHLQHAKKVKLK